MDAGSLNGITNKPATLGNMSDGICLSIPLSFAPQGQTAIRNRKLRVLAHFSTHLLFATSDCGKRFPLMVHTIPTGPYAWPVIHDTVSTRSHLLRTFASFRLGSGSVADARGRLTRGMQTKRTGQPRRIGGLRRGLKEVAGDVSCTGLPHYGCRAVLLTLAPNFTVCSNLYFE